MREPTERERARAREIALGAAGRISSGLGLGEANVVEALAAEVLETVVKSYQDDSWVDSGLEPTINFQLLLERLR